MTNNEKYLRNQLSVLTADWSHMDWRKVRNIDYFFSDYMSVEQGLLHKIERIRYYNDNGVVKPYSRPVIEMNIDDIERKYNRQKSLLDPSLLDTSKKEVTDEEADSDRPFV